MASFRILILNFRAIRGHHQEDSMRFSILFAALLLFAGTSGAQSKATSSQDMIPPNLVPTGKDMFKQYCGHGGEFPYDLVTNVLRFGPGVAAHGSSDMPTWGGIFQYMDNYNQAVVQKRIKNLCDYLVSLQEK
jgi:hypothetical protein